MFVCSRYAIFVRAFGMHQHRCIIMQRINTSRLRLFFRLFLLENFARSLARFCLVDEAHNFANNNSDRKETLRMTGSRFRVVDNKRLIVKGHTGSVLRALDSIQRNRGRFQLNSNENFIKIFIKIKFL